MGRNLIFNREKFAKNIRGFYYRHIYKHDTSWKSFRDFYENIESFIGPYEEGHWVRLKDVNKSAEPDNLHWVKYNKRIKYSVLINGEPKAVTSLLSKTQYNHYKRAIRTYQLSTDEAFKYARLSKDERNNLKVKGLRTLL